jgi:hypothetical protein
MTDEHARRTRPIDVLGWLCLIATLLSTSFVVAVRADEPEEALMSVDPALAAPPPAVAPSVPAAPAPRIVPLNTRGYNYGPPPDAIDDAAKRYERPARPGTPAAPAPTPPR